MVRIVYGVSGEGSGHSSRAREVLTHLLAAGHEVRVVSYDRGVRNLGSDFEVYEVEGLEIATRDNQVSIVRTFTDNIAKLSDGWKSLRGLRHDVFDAFDPEVVITDFEPMTAHLAGHRELPLISLDNQHRMRYLDLPTPAGMEADAKMTRAVIRMLVPTPDVSLVTSFVDGPKKNARTFVFPPILRQAVLACEAQPTEACAPVLVYLTKGFERLVDLLAEFPRERFQVYGTKHEGSDGNREFCAPSSAGFLRDLARSKAVVSTAGFTLMTEALQLGRPMLALPMRGQFEQELNAHLLSTSGYGASSRELTRETIGAFLYALPDYCAALRDYPRGDNAALFECLDWLLDGSGARARAFREARRDGDAPPQFLARSPDTRAC